MLSGCARWALRLLPLGQGQIWATAQHPFFRLAFVRGRDYSELELYSLHLIYI